MLTRHNLELGIMPKRMDAVAFVYTRFFFALTKIMWAADVLR